MSGLVQRFWRWYERHYLVNLSVATGLFVLQAFHLGKQVQLWKTHRQEEGDEGYVYRKPAADERSSVCPLRYPPTLTAVHYRLEAKDAASN